MQIITTILPIFIVIGLGWGARKKGFISPEFLFPANRLTFYLAIPALIFRAISKGAIRHHFNGADIFIPLGAAATTYTLAWVVSKIRRMPGGRAGTFIQSSAHGNQGYVGLPVIFYYLGDDGLAQAGIIAGFLFILQNIFSVSFLQTQAAATDPRGGVRDILKKVFTNPVILSALTGILFSALQIPVPRVVARTLDMMSGLAPPMALLLIGATLSIQGVRTHFRATLGAVSIKLLVLPAIGLALYTYLGIRAADFLPGLILMGCPSATVTYILAKEMKGDPEFAAATISASTLFSGATFSLWLMLIHYLYPA